MVREQNLHYVTVCAVKMYVQTQSESILKTKQISIRYNGVMKPCRWQLCTILDISYIYIFNLNATSNNSRRGSNSSRLLRFDSYASRDFIRFYSFFSLDQHPPAPGVTWPPTFLFQTTREQQSPSHRKTE